MASRQVGRGEYRFMALGQLVSCPERDALVVALQPAARRGGRTFSRAVRRMFILLTRALPLLGVHI